MTVDLPFLCLLSESAWEGGCPCHYCVVDDLENDLFDPFLSLFLSPSLYPISPAAHVPCCQNPSLLILIMTLSPLLSFHEDHDRCCYRAQNVPHLARLGHADVAATVAKNDVEAGEEVEEGHGEDPTDSQAAFGCVFAVVEPVPHSAVHRDEADNVRYVEVDLAEIAHLVGEVAADPEVGTGHEAVVALVEVEESAVVLGQPHYVEGEEQGVGNAVVAHLNHEVETVVD